MFIADKYIWFDQKYYNYGCIIMAVILEGDRHFYVAFVVNKNNIYYVTFATFKVIKFLIKLQLKISQQLLSQI